MDHDARARRDAILSTVDVAVERVDGLPAMVVRFRGACGGVDLATCLVEDEVGLPWGWTGTAGTRDMPVPLPGRARLTRALGDVNAAGWCRGEAPIGSVNHVTTPPVGLLLWTAFPDHHGSVARRISDLVAEALPRAGFSASFVGMLACLREWHPGIGLRSVDVSPLCGDSAVAASLRRFVAGNPFLAQVGADRALAACVASGGAPVDPVALFPGMGAARLRRLSRPAWSPMAEDPFEGGALDHLVGERGYANLVALVEAMPPDWIPEDPEGIAMLWRVAETWPGRGSLDVDARSLMASAKGDWKAFHDRCMGAAKVLEWLPDADGKSAFLSDPVADLARRVVAPLVASMGLESDHEGCLAAATSLLYRDRSLPACIEAAAEWHRALPAIEAAMPCDADADGTGWEPLRGPATVDGISIVPLVTALDLREEGAPGPDRAGVPGLDHCVASYRSDASRGLVHLLSLRRIHPDCSYERLATAEMIQYHDGRVRVVQLRGRRNGEPDAKCGRALASYTSRSLPYVEPRGLSGDPTRDACGYDWRDGDLLDAACEAYAAVLPREARGGAIALAGWLGIEPPDA